MRFIKTKAIFFLALLAFNAVASPIANAITDPEFYGSNHIPYYDDTDCNVSNAASASTNGGETGVSGGSGPTQVSPPSATREDFIKNNIDAAIQVGTKYGIPYEAILAQGALESGNGKSSLAAKYNNFFGIKTGSNWKGQSVNLSTQEDSGGGNMYTIKDGFRVYPTPAEGWDGYGQFITGNSRYKPALRYPTDPFKYIQEIKNAGYATDSSYVSKNSVIIREVIEQAKKLGKQPSSVTNANVTTAPAADGDTSPQPALDPDQNRVDPVNVCCGSGGNATGSVQLEGKDNIEKILNFYMGKGLTLAQAAGFVGNYQEETAGTFDPNIVQGGGKSETPVSGKGYGLAQWTDAGRQRGLVEFAKSQNKKPNDLSVQLEYSWKELNSGGYKTLSQLKAEVTGSNAGNARLATLIVHGRLPEKKYGQGYEASKHIGNDNYILNGERGNFAQKIYDQYKDAPPTGSAGGTADASGRSPMTSTDPGVITSGNDDIADPGDAEDGASPSDNDPSGSTQKATIAIDPGHGAPNTATDAATGVVMTESDNGKETDDVWEASKLLKAKLEKAGYKAVVVKNSVREKMTFRERVTRAEQAGADLAVSLHTTNGAGYTAAQAKDNYRYKSQKVNGSSKASDKVVFQNAATASKSQEYAKKIHDARVKVEGGKNDLITDMSISFGASSGRDIANGNIAYVMLFADKLPWVYNEYGLTGHPFSAEKYAEGVFQGIVAANPTHNADNGTGEDAAAKCAGGSGGGDSSGLQATILKYAWPSYKGKGYTSKKPEYAAAISKAQSAGQYVGGCTGVDCGAFVTRVMIDSGFEPNYNSSGKGGATKEQEKWTKAHWQSLGSGSSLKLTDLQPGDVAFIDGHTWMFVGDIPGFNSKFASASLCGRAPMAGRETTTGGSSTRWYRKK